MPSTANRHLKCLGKILSGFLASCLVLPLVAHAGADPWSTFRAPDFALTTTGDGLPHSVTTALAQDTRGIVWIGTMSGLARYDGLEMEVFDARQDPPTGMPDAYVRALLALGDGSLLVGTSAGGLARFDPLDNSFHTWPIGRGGTSNNRIYDLAHASGDGAWVATADGLDHLDLDSGEIVPVNPGGATSGWNFSVLEDSTGALWVGNARGLLMRPPGSDEFTRPQVADPAIAAVLADQIWSIAETPAGELWFGSVRTGAVFRDVGGNWHGVPGLFSEKRDRRWATVRAIIPAGDGEIWLATDGGGVAHHDPASGETRRVRHDPGMRNALPGDSVRALLRDRTGNIWIATNRGVARTNPHAQVAFSVLPSPDADHALSGNNVNGVFIDSRDRIWLGLEEGKIDMLDLAAGRMHHLQAPRVHANRDVMSFLEMADGSIWAGSQGITRIDPDTLAVDSQTVPELDERPVLSMARDGDLVLIGTYEGLFIHDLRSGETTRARHDSTVPGSLINDTVRSISRIGGHWWYATARGISIAPHAGATSGFRNLVDGDVDRIVMPRNTAGRVSAGRDDTIWIPTFDGLVLARVRAGAAPTPLRVFTTDDGLSSNQVNAVLEGANGSTWVSVANGINLLDAQRGGARLLSRRDGLGLDGYVSLGAARTRHGELLFGALGGLTVIRPDALTPPTGVAPLIVTRATIGRDALDYGALPGPGETLTLEPGARKLRLDFALLDYGDPRHTRYSYRIPGLDPDWNTITPGNVPSAVYTNLPHGAFELVLRAQTDGIFPQTIETRIPLDIVPLWHETRSARILALVLFLLLVVAAILGGVHLRTWVLHQRARQLQERIDLRTHELREANARLDRLAGTDSLTGIYNRRRFIELVRRELEEHPDRPACIALLDLDHFKHVNDTWGHLAGDEVLRTTINVIRDNSRSQDLVGRFGGEEILLFMPTTGPAAAMQVAERIRALVAAQRSVWNGEEISVTISIGVAAREAGESLEEWLVRADSALYRAKREGRDATRLHRPLRTP